MNELTLAMRGLPAHTVAALRSMLALLDSALGARWRLLDAPMADVILVPGERMGEIRKPGSEVEVPLLLALTSDSNCPAGAFAILKRPVTPAHLVEVLQLAEGLVERARANDEGMLTVPLIESLDPGGRLAPSTFDTRVRTTLRAATWRLFQQPVGVTVLDDRRDSIYSFLPSHGVTTRLATAELAAAFRANPPAVFVELSRAEQAAMARAREFRSPKELEWTFWISNGHPRLRPELLDPASRWRLKRWPDFGRLPHYHADIRMASALMAQALSLAELCEVAKARTETATNFLNATYTLGALVAEAKAAAPVAAAATKETKALRAPGGFSGLIAQLRRKFGLAQADAV